MALIAVAMAMSETTTPAPVRKDKAPVDVITSTGLAAGAVLGGAAGYLLGSAHSGHGNGPEPAPVPELAPVAVMAVGIYGISRRRRRR